MLRRAATALASLFGGSGRTAVARSYNAAGHGWRQSPTMPSPASAGLAASRPVGERVAWLTANSPHAAAAREALVSAHIGDGPAFRSAHPDPVIARRLGDAYMQRLWPNLEVETGACLGQLLATAERCRLTWGEAVAQLLVEPETGRPLVRLLNPNQLDRDKNVDATADGGRIVAGVQFDRLGRRIAYWIIPDRTDFPTAVVHESVPIGAADVMHLYEQQTPGQVRGVSPLVAAVTRFTEIDKLEDAVAAQANTAALFGVIFHTPAGDLAPFDQATNPNFPGLSPGAAMIAPNGYTPTVVDPPSSAEPVAFLRAMLRSAAAGAGLPYEALTGDLSQVNYSSAKLGFSEFRRRVNAYQKNILVPQVLDPLWKRFVALEILAGRLDVPADDEAVYRGEFIFRAWESLDPKGETEAEILAIDAGIRSRFEVISARGRDPQDVDAERDADTSRPMPKEPPNA